MKKWMVLICLVLTVSVFVSGIETSVDYLEGILEVQSTGGWEEIGIGDTIEPDAKVRLSDDGYAELLVGDALVTLSRDGLYEVEQLIGGVAGLSGSNLNLKQKITMSTGHDKWQHEATMGVRGAEQTRSDNGTGMEDAFTYLDAGMEALSEEDYEEALVNFDEGWEFFEDANCLFFSAVCYEALGERRSYARSLMEVEGDELEPDFQAAFVIRKSDLLMRSLEYGEAVTLLEDFLKGSSDASVEEKQQARYLLGTGYLGLDRSSKAAGEFRKARDLSPSSDIGKQADQALKSL